MVSLVIIVTVAPRRLARAVPIRRVAVHQFGAVKRVVRQVFVSASLYPLYRISALELRQRQRINVNADVAQGRRFALGELQQ